MSCTVLYFDRYLLAINKPPGMASENNKHDTNTAENWAIQYCLNAFPKNKNPFCSLSHRLDKPASGILLFALKPSVLKHLNKQFSERLIQKKYRAVTDKSLPQNNTELHHWHIKDTLQYKAKLFEQPKNGTLPVALQYQLISVTNGLYQWDINLLTGKYHQIRAQMAFMGCPLLGDTLYGSTTNYLSNAIALHAYSLTCTHPFSNEQLKIIAPLPKYEIWA